MGKSWKLGGIYMKYNKIVAACFLCFIIISCSLNSVNASTVDNLINEWSEETNKLEKKEYYNLGYIKITYEDKNPGTIYGGTWTKIASGKSLIGVSSTIGVRDTGGEKETTLTSNNLPAHNHTGTVNISGNHSHSFYSIYGTSNVYGAYFMTTESGKGLATNAGGRRLVEGYASIGSAGEHNHSFTTNSQGKSQAHNNMQPYVTVYYWEKTSNASKTPTTFSGTTQQKLDKISATLDSLKRTTYYSVGDVITLTTDIDPATVYGGTWKRTAKGKSLVGVDSTDDDFSQSRNTGGEKTHTLTNDELPIHSHTGSTSTDGYHSHGYNKNTSNAYGTAFYTDNYHGWPLYSNNPYDGNCSGWYVRENYIDISSSGTHSHSFTTSETGGSGAHNNLMPYYTVYMWEKISDT